MHWQAQAGARQSLSSMIPGRPRALSASESSLAGSASFIPFPAQPDSSHSPFCPPPPLRARNSSITASESSMSLFLDSPAPSAAPLSPDVSSTFIPFADGHSLSAYCSPMPPGRRALRGSVTGLFLTREFKHDETNRAWWTGPWYGRGFGAQAFSQAVREYVVKIIELSLWSLDLLLGHLLLFMLSPPLLIPGFDRLHAVMLFWLRPSKQIRAPLYSMKQSSQRRAIIIKYGIVYLLALTFFILMIALRDSGIQNVAPFQLFGV
ncbi:hypothetical protein C8J56DRAFT_1091613 [Mycena floridula]|nr:hypothetical protein C8J56DRAFT_1091613 [Mycena floridula]